MTTSFRHWRSLAQKAGIQAAPWIPRHVRQGETRFRLPVLSYGQPVTLANESWLTDWLARTLRLSPGHLIDVGANIGQTLIKVKSLDPAQPYLGFEPNPSAAFFLQRLIEVNGLDAAVVPAALSDAPGVLRIARGGRFDSSASIVDGFRPAAFYAHAEDYVAVLTGDVVLEQIGGVTPGVIKIDTEGGELDVLSGLEQTLKTHRPIVICEVLPTANQDAAANELRATRKARLESLLTGTGYDIFRLVFDHTRLFPCDTFPGDDDLHAVDYLFLPNDRPHADILRDKGFMEGDA